VGNPHSGLAYDLVAVDVDGTLLDSQGELSPGTAEAFQEARQQGVRLTLVSGRAKVSLLHILEALRIDQPYIAAQGAYIADPISGEVIHQQAMSQQDTEAIVRIARALDVSVFYENPDRIYGEMKPRHANLVHGDEHVALVLVDDLLHEAPGPPPKMAILGEPELLRQVEQRIRSHNPSLHAAYPFPTALDVSRPGVTKGVALRKLAHHFGIPLSRVVAIGDQNNDLTMFEVAGLSVAMGNAPPEVKAAADIVAPSNDEGGVAWALRELVLKPARS
jgi:Cof subfamily protein (haloacid dehalogenase superfamily)